MKTTIFKISAFILLFTLMGAGCENEEDISQSILNGKWILVGFGNDSTDEFIFEPESEPKSSYVTFDNGNLDAFSVTNRTFNMKYLIEKDNTLSITPGIMTLVGSDTEWGQKFLLSINDIYKFDRNNNDLILYYEGQRFMKFQKETK